MTIQRTSHWLLGSAFAVAFVYFASIATAETFAEAFEPDLESAWEKLGAA